MFIKGQPLQKEATEYIKNILIIQLGDIGDVVWVTPTLRAAKEKYPNAKVSILVWEGFGTLLEEDPSLHKIFEVRRYKGSFFRKAIEQIRFIRGLRKEQFDLVFDLRAGDRGAIMAYITGAPVRVSMFYCEVPFWRNMLFTHVVDPPLPTKKTLGAAEQSLRIVREFGIDTKNIVPKLWVSENVKEQVRQLLDRQNILNVNQRWITLNPFSRWQYKEWSYDKWVQVIDWIWDRHGFPAVIVGSPEEKNKALELVKKCRGKVFNLAGQTTLSELAGVLALSFLHIGVDSAAPHIAAAVGIPTITIYGPSDWRDWAPPGDNHRVVTPDDDCVPCHQKGCDSTGWSKCLQNLGTDKVQRAIQEMMETLSPR
ncbi:MAG: putative lipopolysaccharide heptosyltransferase III [Deltaproteobacteria bacterium]|nr:MAG: putative lipopolysaccharide heptosyltransferase III [Deltaproteobacteria bacterium]